MPEENVHPVSFATEGGFIASKRYSFPEISPNKNSTNRILPSNIHKQSQLLLTQGRCAWSCEWMLK